MCQDPKWVLVLIPIATIPVQVPACGLGKQLRMAQSLGPCTRVGDPEESSGSWIQINTTLAIAVTWAVNQWMEDLSLSPLFSVYLTFQ